ncbi:MAG: TRAP-type C4-dicarboxylate transport system permease small subunit [Arenicella sp.]|jgi:TRAP-type C4-dicarboxylate transport system permease small subunit
MKNKNLQHIFSTINHAMEKVESTILTVAILIMMCNSCMNAAGRYFFGHSLYFSEELNRFLIIAITFIGLAYAVRLGRNIRMTALYDLLSVKGKKIATMIIAVTTAALMFYLTYLALIYVVEIKQLNRHSPSLQFPVYIVYSIIPVGFFMAGLQYLLSFLMNLTHPEIYVSADLIESEDTPF